ncbi:MAG: ArsA family ATPase [Myxococcota bacterium]
MSAAVSTESTPRPSDALFESRLTLVTGKGGVGKSSVSAAMAVAAANQGRRVLLVELGSRPVMGELLGGQTPKHVPSLVARDRFPNLWVSHIDPRKALQEYLIEAIKVKSLAKLATENRVLARLWQAAPSVDEMAVLTALERFELARDPGDASRPRFDTIVVDLPATGHAKAMLAVPRGLFAMIRVGALADRAKSVDEMLHDRTRSAIVIVTLPEELPINESVQLASSLRNDLELSTAALVINAVLPRIYSEEERALIDRIARQLNDSVGHRVLRAATHQSDRQEKQAKQIALVRDQLDTQFVEIAFSPGQGVGLIEQMAAALNG